MLASTAMSWCCLADLFVWNIRQLRHPNVVLFLGCCHDPANNSLSIVTEFMERGSLSDVLADKSIQVLLLLLLLLLLLMLLPDPTRRR